MAACGPGGCALGLVGAAEAFASQAGKKPQDMLNDIILNDIRFLKILKIAKRVRLASKSNIFEIFFTL
jgi:hypothetical protein